jgi:hypothetical protein
MNHESQARTDIFLKNILSAINIFNLIIMNSTLRTLKIIFTLSTIIIVDSQDDFGPLKSQAPPSGGTVEVPKKTLNACDMFVSGPNSDSCQKSHFGPGLVRPTFVKDLVSNLHDTQRLPSPNPCFRLSIFLRCLLISLSHSRSFP